MFESDVTYQSTPLISVIIAVFNGVKTLQQCLNSVIQQNYKNIELIVIDGGSSDGTVDLLVSNSRDITYWISEADHGIYNAWNKALEQAHGDWICFLGADDFLWDEQVLVRMVSELILIPPVIRVAYGQIMLINAASVKLHAIGKPWEEVKEHFKHLMCIPHPAVMHRRSLFLQHGAFDESFRIAGDYELLLRELRTNDAFFIPGVVMTAMRQGGVSTDPDNTLLGLQEVRAAQIKNGQRWPGLVWLLALTRAYTRSLLWSFMGEKITRKILDFGRKIMGLPAYWTKI